MNQKQKEHFPQPPQLPQQQTQPLDQKQKKKKEGSRDKLFVLVTAIVLGNLAFNLWGTLSWLIVEPASTFLWSLFIANLVAIIGLLYLMRDYTRRIKADKAKAKLAELLKANDNAETE